MTVDFHFSILYKLHCKKTKEGNREPFSTCTSETEAWRSSLVLVMANPWLSDSLSELTCMSMDVPGHIPPRQAHTAFTAYLFVKYVLPITFKECH